MFRNHRWAAWLVVPAALVLLASLPLNAALPYVLLSAPPFLGVPVFLYAATSPSARRVATSLALLRGVGAAMVVWGLVVALWYWPLTIVHHLVAFALLGVTRGHAPDERRRERQLGWAMVVTGVSLVPAAYVLIWLGGLTPTSLVGLAGLIVGGGVWIFEARRSRELDVVLPAAVVHA